MSPSAVSGAPPDAYERHVGRYGASLGAEMIRVSGAHRGQRALDVGCGPGALTEKLAALLGPVAVAAVDPSEAFVHACRARAAPADVRVGVAERLPFPDTSFDVVLAQLVVDGMDDPRRGVAEMRRVTKPGGVAAACVWRFGGGMRLLDTMWEAALAANEELARSFGAGSRLPFSQAAELDELWQSSGFEPVELGEVTAEAEYRDFDDLWYPFAAGVGGLGRFVAALGEPAREAFKDDARRRFGSPAGPFRLEARALYVLGAAPDTT